MKDKHTYGGKMARNGGTKVIYKGTFISDQPLEMGFICLYVVIQKSGQKTAKSHLCALRTLNEIELGVSPADVKYL